MDEAAAMKRWPSLRKAMTADVESHDGREKVLLDFIYNHPSLPQMRGSPSKVIKAIDEFAGNHEFLINIGEDKGRIVADLIAKEKPIVLVEMGGYIGYSAILFGDAIRQANVQNGGDPPRLWSLEMDPLCASIAMNLVDLAGLSDIVKVVVGRADESLRSLHASGQLARLDMLFLDHVEDLYVVDFQVCESLALLRKGTLVVADNVVRPGAPEYRRLVRSHTGLESKGVRGLIMPGGFEDELEVTRVIEDIDQGSSLRVQGLSDQRSLRQVYL